MKKQAFMKLGYSIRYAFQKRFWLFARKKPFMFLTSRELNIKKKKKTKKIALSKILHKNVKKHKVFKTKNIKKPKYGPKLQKLQKSFFFTKPKRETERNLKSFEKNIRQIIDFKTSIVNDIKINAPLLKQKISQYFSYEKLKKIKQKNVFKFYSRLMPKRKVKKKYTKFNSNFKLNRRHNLKKTFSWQAKSSNSKNVFVKPFRITKR